PELYRLIDRHDAGDDLAVLQHRRCSVRVLSRDDFILAGRKNDRSINRAIDLRERGRVESARRPERTGAGDEEPLRAFGDEDPLLYQLLLRPDDHVRGVLLGREMSNGVPERVDMR